MKKALIFDFDGTLADSYDAICDRLYRLFLSHKIHYDTKQIKEGVLKHSTKHFLKEACEIHDLSYVEMEQELKNTSENYSLISLMPNAKQMLEACKKEGIHCYIFTHRGKSTKGVMEALRIASYFEEIVDMTKGFARKPSPDAIEYLMKKYQLDKENTYYVGDRELDIGCGKNANIKTIFLRNPEVKIDYKDADIVVDDLSEIVYKL